jgi:sn-glycerol 3-phosphate transport system permease protein
MVENRPWLTFLAHGVLIAGVLVVAFPLWITFVASTLTYDEIIHVPMPLLPGDQLLENYSQVLTAGSQKGSSAPVSMMLLNSFIMATGVAVGKIAISIISAFAIVYFRFPLRNFFFWMIFVTLMLPIEVRIIPTFKVASDLHLLDSYAGLILPIIASATATFLFRQFFLTIPDELCEAARIDGASPWQFFRLILLPLSRSNIVALAIILFLTGWNQYLWPLLLTTEPEMANAVVGLKKLMPQSDSLPTWHLLMNAAFLTMLPPTLVILLLQRWFVKGLVDSGK